MQIGQAFQLIKDYGQPAAAVCAAITAGFAARTYWRSQRLEESKFLVQLFENFYESESYKTVREILDCASETAALQGLVTEEFPHFTDYLNFFEMVAILIRQQQLRPGNVISLFDYYLRCLRRNPAVYAYIKNESNGFEELSKLLSSTG